MEKTIYCPSCKRKVFSFDGRGSINIRGKCKKCNRLVVYHIETDEVTMHSLPTRTCSSGKTIY